MKSLTRTRWKTLAAGTPLTLLAAAAALPMQCAAEVPEQKGASWTFHHEHVLGTSLEIRVEAANFAEARRAEAAALEEIDRQDGLLSAWKPGSEFSRWARTRFEPVQVSPELMEVLAAFDHWRERTGGALDASAEAAVRLWREATAEGRRPSEAEMAQVREAIAQPHWQLDASRGTATRLTDVPLALASFAKSYVSSRAADAALAAGAQGVMLNLGGDVVVRGEARQLVALADPQHTADNDAPLDHLVLRDAAMATSGSYRRGFELAGAAGLRTTGLPTTGLRAPAYSHVVDPRRAEPTGHVLSSTVIAPDAETAGALATAFSVMSPEESEQMAAATPGVEYLLVLRGGERLESAGWSRYRAPGVRPVSYTPATHAAGAVALHGADAGAWNPAFDLNIGLELPRIEDARYRRPYVAVWIEDGDHFPVRTLALWTENPRWLPELRQWYHEDQMRNLSENTDVSKTTSSATRPPGKYMLRWDGKDNAGKPVAAGKYTVVVEASREHGGYQIDRHEMNFDAQPQQATLQPGKELGTTTLDYRKR